MVLAPEHDGLTDPNVLTLLGSLNPVDDAWLADARAAFPTLAVLPSPRTAVLLGGDSSSIRGSMRVIGVARCPSNVSYYPVNFVGDVPLKLRVQYFLINLSDKLSRHGWVPFLARLSQQCPIDSQNRT